MAPSLFLYSTRITYIGGCVYVECLFAEFSKIDEKLLQKTISLLYKIDNPETTLCIDDNRICLIRKSHGGNYIEIYPEMDKITWKLFDSTMELVTTRISKW